MGVPYQITRSAHGLDTSFMDDALCRTEGHRSDKFFMEYERGADGRVMAMEARSVCMRCSVRGDCFLYAVAADEHGIWGGTTREQRMFFSSHGYLPPPDPPRRTRRGVVAS